MENDNTLKISKLGVRLLKQTVAAIKGLTEFKKLGVALIDQFEQTFITKRSKGISLTLNLAETKVDFQIPSNCHLSTQELSDTIAELIANALAETETRRAKLSKSSLTLETNDEPQPITLV